MISSELLERAEDYVQKNFANENQINFRLGAEPSQITDDERAQMLETHQSYFANMLFDFMKRKNLSEADVAAKARMNAEFFSRLRNDRKYVPEERTVWATVFALKLNLDEANSLMHRLKYFLGTKVPEEVLLAFCLENGVHDLDSVNEILEHYGFAPLEVTEDFTLPPDFKKFRDEDLTTRIDLYLEKFFHEPPTSTGGIKFSYIASPLGEPAETSKTFEVIIRKLKNVIGISGNLFSDYLLTLIKQKNLSEVEVYKRAHLDRRVFSKIRNKKTYMPAKKTVLAIAFGMKLDFKETNTLLARAGYSLSNARKEDVIAAYFIDNQIYDLFLINEVLDYYGCPTIGD